MNTGEMDNDVIDNEKQYVAPGVMIHSDSPINMYYNRNRPNPTMGPIMEHADNFE